MVEFFLCAWFAVLTIYGLRLLLGPNDDYKEAEFTMRSVPAERVVEIRVRVMLTNGESWRVTHRCDEDEVKQIIRVCGESIGAIPKR